MKNKELQFIENLKKAGGEILDEIPDNWYSTKALLGVVENGAVWIDEYVKELFLSENVAVILNKNSIVETTEEAMEYINTPGVFISGPSKTADVESFLVYGAHGPIRLGIYLI